MLSSKEQNSQPLSLLIKKILPVVTGMSQDSRFHYFSRMQTVRLLIFRKVEVTLSCSKYALFDVNELPI